MTDRNWYRGGNKLVVVLVCVLVTALTAACSGGSAPTTAVASATPSAVSTASPATGAPTAAVAMPTAAAVTATSPIEPTGPASTLGGATDLAALIPTEVGGFPMSTIVLTEDLLAVQDLQHYEDLVASLSKSMDDLDVVLGQAGGTSLNEQVSVRAFRVAGADGAALVQSEIERLLAVMIEGTEQESVSVGGKDVIQLGEQDPSFPKFAQYVYGVGDTVFTVQGGSDELIAELFSLLP